MWPFRRAYDNRMTPSKVPTVALYARVSTQDQNCEMQLNEMREYAERRGWRLHGEYVDMGWGGAKRDRPQLGKLMKDAMMHRFDIILVWKLDRFGRSVSNLLDQIEQLTHGGVRFLCITQAIDTDDANPASRLLLQVLAAVAEFERSMIRERVKAGMKAAAKRGLHCGRNKLLFDRDQVAALHLQGKTERQIAAALRIGKGTVSRILKTRAA